MELSGFWKIINDSIEQNKTELDQVNWIERNLLQNSVVDLFGFQVHFEDSLLTFYHSAKDISPADKDAVYYSGTELILKGREKFESVLVHSDATLNFLESLNIMTVNEPHLLATAAERVFRRKQKKGICMADSDAVFLNLNNLEEVEQEMLNEMESENEKRMSI